MQIQTIHRSKGLEYPIVYLPYLWHAFPDRDTMPLYPDPGNDDRRTIDVGGERPEGYQGHRTRAAGRTHRATATMSGKAVSRTRGRAPTMLESKAESRIPTV